MKRLIKTTAFILLLAFLLVVIVYSFIRVIPILKAATEFALLIWYLVMSA